MIELEQQTKRPAVFSATTIPQTEKISITGREPVSPRLFSILEMDVVEKMIARNDPISERTLEIYNLTKKANEQKIIEEKKKQEEKKLLDEKKVEPAVEKLENETKNQSIEEKKTEADTQKSVKIEEKTSEIVLEAKKDELLLTENKKEEELPPIEKKVELEAKPMPKQIKPTIIKINELVAVQKPEEIQAKQTISLARGIEKIEPNSKPRVVSVVDFGLIENQKGKNETDEATIKEIARQLANVPKPTGVINDKKETPLEPAELAIKIYEEKKKRSSLTYKISKMLGMTKEEKQENNN